jgi:plastocyanin
MSVAYRRFGACLAAIVLIPACAIALGNGIHEVAQADRKFQASEITIARGETVRFTNDDPYLHQIYVDAHNFDFESSLQPPQAIVDVRFPSSGVYEVMCHIHPTMHLLVTVE